MIEHLVWFKLKPEVTSEQTRDLLEGLRALPAQIPGILHLACGEDFSGRSQGYQVGLVVRFESREALANYGPHPAHETFIATFRPLWESVMALDFEG